MLIAVGGHSRNIGKTSVVCGIIAATPECRWQAIKITQHGNHACTTDGAPCECDPGDPLHPYALDEQTAADRTDSGRYLAAGAARSWWLRTAQGELGHALGALKDLLAQAEHTVVESNSLLRFLKPDLYVVVLDFGVTDIKDSSRLYMDWANAFVIVERGISSPPWPGIPQRWFQGKPSFVVSPPSYMSDDLVNFIRERVYAGNP
jgi:hypothetical protein